MRTKSGSKRVLMLVENCDFLEDIRVRHEAATLSEAGHVVSVICQSRSNRPWHELLAGIRVFRFQIPVSGKGAVSYAVEFSYSLLAMFLLSLLVLWKPGFDIIHAANPPDTAVIMAALYKILGKRFVFDQHDLSPEVYLLRFGTDKKAGGLIYKALLGLERLSCSLADHVIAPNESYRTLQIQRDGVPAERITVVRNGPDLDTHALVHPIADIRRNGKKTLLYLGVIGYQDGVDYLLRSLFKLRYDLGREDFLCVVAGDGNALPSLRLQAAELRLDDLVLFPGWIESVNVASYINAADICLAPEPSNDLNDRSTIVKIMEYMAGRKPVVAFDLPEHRVTAQNAATYAEPNRELDFAYKIASLMDDPEKCNKMGQIARERVEKELSWAHQRARLMEAYSKISV